MDAGQHEQRAHGALTDAELTMLTLEQQFPVHSSQKQRLISARLGLTASRYYRDLSSLVETERAVRFDPLLTARLRRSRDAARLQRGVTRSATAA